LAQVYKQGAPNGAYMHPCAGRLFNRTIPCQNDALFSQIRYRSALVAASFGAAAADVNSGSFCAVFEFGENKAAGGSLKRA